MREIKDNLYIFRFCQQNIGQIVAKRDFVGMIDVGEDVFELLNISNSERAFFIECMKKGGDSCVAVAGGEDENKRIIIFVRFFAYSSSLCLAISLDFPAENTVAAICSGVVDDILISPEVLDMQSLSVRDTDAERYIRSLWLLLSSTYHMGLKNGFDNPYELERALADACRVVGIEPRCRFVREDDGFDHREPRGVFAGRLCVAFGFVMAMLTRENSNAREMQIDIIYNSNGVELEFICDSGDGRAMEMSVPMLLEIIDAYGLTAHAEHDGHTFKCRLDPHYADVSLVGAKQGENEFACAGWREIF